MDVVAVTEEDLAVDVEVDEVDLEETVVDVVVAEEDLGVIVVVEVAVQLEVCFSSLSSFTISILQTLTFGTGWE